MNCQKKMKQHYGVNLNMWQEYYPNLSSVKDTLEILYSY